MKMLWKVVEYCNGGSPITAAKFMEKEDAKAFKKAVKKINSSLDDDFTYKIKRTKAR